VGIDDSKGSPVYARFTRRVQALCIDSIIIMLILTGALFIAVSLESNHVGRVLGFTVAATLLLYEPLLVSLTGSTLGHRYCNMRVVDDRSGGNISFLKAVLRVIIKTALGWYSFISMVATARHQALHDLLTRSTVQVRDRTRAKPHHFAGERAAQAGTPSATRRIVAILGYLAIWFAIIMLVNFAMLVGGLLSARCIHADLCSPVERWIDVGVSAIWLGVSVLLIGLGWRGKLWGARRIAPAQAG
jgi:hypothetical protein